MSNSVLCWLKCSLNISILCLRYFTSLKSFSCYWNSSILVIKTVWKLFWECFREILTRILSSQHFIRISLINLWIIEFSIRSLLLKLINNWLISIKKDLTLITSSCPLSQQLLHQMLGTRNLPNTTPSPTWSDSPIKPYQVRIPSLLKRESWTIIPVSLMQKNIKEISQDFSKLEVISLSSSRLPSS